MNRAAGYRMPKGEPLGMGTARIINESIARSRHEAHPQSPASDLCCNFSVSL